jgi:hypothetical protein
LQCCSCCMPDNVGHMYAARQCDLVV